MPCQVSNPSHPIGVPQETIEYRSFSRSVAAMLLSGRYERRPTLITSNKSLTDWAAIVQDASLAAALVDRILHHGDVFYLKGPSWRVKGRSPDDTGSSMTDAAPV